jgi:hypothetical protein
VRAAAAADFLRSLRAHGSADLNGLLSTLNDGGLARETLAYWKDHGWVSVAPDTPLIALVGPRFDVRLSLSQFCGAAPPPAQPEEQQDDDENP